MKTNKIKTTEIYKDFATLLIQLENDINIKNGLILPNIKKYSITRKINSEWEEINLSQYENSEDLILVETKEFAFTISRWNDTFTLGQQITLKTNKK